MTFTRAQVKHKGQFNALRSVDCLHVALGVLQRRLMKVEFVDDDLARIRTDQAFRLGLPVAVIQTARKRIYQLEAAKDERDLRNLKSLNYKKRKGEREELHSIRVNDQYRIVFRLLESESPPILQIVEIGDTH